MLDGVNLWDMLMIPVTLSYIFSLIFIADKSKKSGKISSPTARKLVHIGVGSVVVVIPVVCSSNLIPILLGGLFVGISLLTSPGSPLDRFKISAFTDGHPFGTVYYAISLTILIFAFFNTPWIILAIFLPLVFGDGFGSLVGLRYGRRKWTSYTDKTLMGVFGSI